MNKQTALYISERACPSISYRIRKEIFHEDITKPDMQALQSKILNESEILRIFSLKKQDGWLGGLFHGVDEPVCSIRYLIEKGVEPNHPIIQNALNGIIARGDKFDEGSMYRVGKPLDNLHIGGSKLIKACFSLTQETRTMILSKNRLMNHLMCLNMYVVLRVLQIYMMNTKKNWYLKVA